MNAQVNARALYTIVRKEVLRFLRIWPQTLVPPAITTTLYLLIFGKMIGDRIGPIAGLSYVDYIMPGVILMAIISNAYANVVSSFYGSKFQHYIEELMIAPIPAWVILVGYMVGGIARGLAVGLVVSAVGMIFTDLHVQHLPVVLAIATLTAMLFALGGFINAIYANSFDDISIIPTFVLTPLTYLGGIFYSIDMLPPFWREASLFNPILYMINAFRYGFLGVADIGLGTAFAIITGFTALLFVFSLYLLKRGVGIRS